MPGSRTLINRFLLLAVLISLPPVAAAQQDSEDSPAAEDDVAPVGFAAGVPPECPEGTRLVECDTPDGFTQACLDMQARQCGWSIQWYPNGNKRSECESVLGRLHGRCMAWHENGNKKVSEHYKDDLRHGPYTSWFTNGKKRCQGEYVKGERHGPWECWFDNGQLRSRGKYAAGNREGRFEYFTPGGEPSPRQVALPTPKKTKRTKLEEEASFKRWMAERNRVPQQLKEAKALVGGCFLEKKLFFELEGLGRVTSVGYGQFDGQAGEETIVVGQTGAVLLAKDGKPGRVTFEKQGRQIQAVDLDSDGRTEYMDIGEGYGPLMAFDYMGTHLFSFDRLHYPRYMAAGDLDGNGELELVVGLGRKGAIHVLDKNGREKSSVAANNIRGLVLADADGDGLAEILHVNWHGRLTIRESDGSIKDTLDLGRTGNRFSLCNFPSRSGEAHALVIRETVARLFDLRGKEKARFDVPLARTGWVQGIMGVPVKLRADRPPYFAVAVKLRPFWKRSLLLIMSPGQEMVFEEVLDDWISALGTGPAGMQGEEQLLVGLSGGKVFSYAFDREYYRKAFQRVIDVFRGSPDAEDLLPVETDNVAEEVRDRWFDWTVFVKGDEEALSKIACVQYRVHPSFPDPVRLVCKRGEGPYPFGLSMSGWGSFAIKVRIHLEDGPVQDMIHQLLLRPDQEPE